VSGLVEAARSRGDGGPLLLQRDVAAPVADPLTKGQHTSGAGAPFPSLPDKERAELIGQVRRRLDRAYPTFIDAVNGLLSLQRTAGNRAATLAVQRQPSKHKDPAKQPQQQEAGTAAKETPTTLEGAIRDRIKDWRAAAGDGVNDFASAELEKAMKSKSVDGRAFAFGLAGNVLWALTAFNPVVYSGTTFAISLAGIFTSAIGGIPTDTGDTSTPITETEQALHHILNELQKEHYRQARAHAAEEQAKYPHLSVDQLVDRVLHWLFEPRALTVQAGEPTEIDKDLIEKQIQAQATDLFNRFQKQVQPIGKGEFDHKKWVLIRIKDGPYAGREALALRTVSEDRLHEKFRIKTLIDEDLTAAAEQRANAVNEVPEVVYHADLQGQTPAGIQEAEGGD
jgi:hypothetical protein